MKNIENILKMPYLHFISTKLDSKSGQIKDLDVTWQMHSITEIFDIVEYLKNETNQNKKKKRENRENRPKRPNKAERPKYFFRQTILKTKQKKKALLNWILSMCWKDTACHTHANKKMKYIENILKMPYLHFIWTKLDS